MNVLEDTLRLIAAWRVYRRMQGERYEQLARDFALVIRSRLR
jgi:hypothetical protein